MKYNSKRIAFVFVGIFVLMFSIQFVAAAEGDNAGVYGQIEGDGKITEFIVSLVNFFGWENTWASFITAIAVLVMVYAAAYDILEFTAFENKYTKMAIALGIALVVAVSRGVTVITAFFLSIAGGSVAIATVIAIALAVVFFVIGTIFKGRLKIFKAKGKALDAEAGAIDAASGVTVSKRMAEAARRGA